MTMLTDHPGHTRPNKGSTIDNTLETRSVSVIGSVPRRKNRMTTIKTALRIMLVGFLVFLVLPYHAQSQESLEGEWWIAIKGKTKGAAKLVFSDLQGGTFKVAGQGTTLSLGEFFVVAPDQVLQRASNGSISGVIAIEDENSNPLGAFDFAKGKVNKTFTKLTLKGDLTNDSTVKVKFIGKRFPSEAPVLSGLTQQGKVGGKGLKSKFYELGVIEDLEGSFPGFPFFSYSGVGPVKIDGVEVDDVQVIGKLVIDSQYKAYGTFSSNDLGSGIASGRLQPGQTSDVPRVKLKAETGRKIKLKGNLEKAISPRISVDPESTLDFGSVNVEDTKTLSFTVTNAGAGMLSGSASVADVNAPYTIVSGSPYNLAEEASTSVEVTFSPTTAGTSTADIDFTGGGGATRSVTGSGAAPSGTLSVEPTDGLVFGNVVVGSSSVLSFTVTNTGASTLEGEASIVGSSAFRLINDQGQPVSLVPYSLNTNDSIAVRVRFQPTATGTASATVSFTGEESVITRAVTGTGTAL